MKTRTPGTGSRQGQRRSARSQAPLWTALIALAACAPEAHVLEEMPDGADQMGLDWGFGGGSTTTVTPPTVAHVTSIEHENLVSPLRIAVDDQGMIYVTDPPRRAIHVFSPLGHYKRSFFLAGKPLGIAVRPDGLLAVGDGERHRVDLYAPTGELMGHLGLGDGEVVTPQDIAVEKQTGITWVVDADEDRVLRYAADGTFLSTFGTSGATAGKFNFPVGLAIDEAKGEVFVSDFNNARVQVFSLAGVYKRSVGRAGNGNGRFVSTQGIALDDADRIYIIDGFQADVSVMTTSGSYASRIGGLGLDPGQLALPSDAVFDSYGRLLVTSYKTGRIEVWGIDDYQTPAMPLPAVVASAPTKLDVQGMSGGERKGERHSQLWIDVADSDAPIDPYSVLVDGALPLAPPVVYDEAVYRDGYLYEVEVRYSRDDLFDRHSSPGTYAIPVTGVLADGVEFEGSFELTVKAGREDAPGQGRQP